jgi:hypothetical protein
MTALIWIGILGLVAFLFWHGLRRERHTLASRFAERPAMPFDAFFQTYYVGKIDAVTLEELLRHAANELALPAEKLLPSDRFDVELRPARGWEMDSGKGILLSELVKLARTKGVQVDVQQISTLDDYLKAMARVY